MLKTVARVLGGRVSAGAAVLVLCGLIGTCSLRIDTLQQVRALGVLRVATVNSPTTYYEGPAGPTGFEYDLALGLAESLGVELKLVLAAKPSDALEMVRSGRAHLAAAGLAVTPQRSGQVRFSRPYLKVVPQLVSRMGRRVPANLDAVGEGLVVPRHSAAAEFLAGHRAAHPDLSWTEDPDRDTEELLLQVADGEIAYTVAPSDLVAINKRYYPKLRVAFDLSEPLDVAWGFPAGADNSLFVPAQHYLSGLSERYLARLRDRYFGHIEQVDYLGAVTLATHVETRLPKYRELFERAGREFDIDWRLLAAIGYQESHWDPKAVSPTGVKGIMQLTLQTARFLKVADREDPTQSIMGGARYIRRLIDILPADVQHPDRVWLALAAYNLGYGHIIDVRELTRQRNGDPRRWVDVRANLRLLTQPRWHQKTRYGYARGHEAQTYVGNVRTYYDMLVYIFGDAPANPAGEPEVQDRAAPAEDPLNIRTPVL